MQPRRAGAGTAGLAAGPGRSRVRHGAAARCRGTSQALAVSDPTLAAPRWLLRVTPGLAPILLLLWSTSTEDLVEEWRRARMKVSTRLGHTMHTPH